MFHFIRYCMRRKHTKDNCRDSASRFNTRSEFSKFDKGMYTTSRVNGWLDEFYPGSGIAKPQNWSLLSAVREARSYGSSGELMSGNRSAYNYLSSLGLVSRVFGNKRRNFWTKGTIRAHALLFEKRGDFYRSYKSAYCAMNRLGCKDYVMNGIQKGKVESDLFYAWQVISPSCSNVWKVGVTSSKLRYKQRANDVSRSLGVSIGMYMEVSLGEKSSLAMEREVLDRFDRFTGICGDGSTELIVASVIDVKNIFKELGGKL